MRRSLRISSIDVGGGCTTRIRQTRVFVPRQHMRCVHALNVFVDHSLPSTATTSHLRMIF